MQMLMLMLFLWQLAFLGENLRITTQILGGLTILE
jgi:hypothetical protein